MAAGAGAPLEKEGRIGPGLTLYGLRHTVAVILREAGHDERTIADALGQKLSKWPGTMPRVRTFAERWLESSKASMRNWPKGERSLSTLAVPCVNLNRCILGKSLILLAGEEGLEPPTPGFGDRCSNQLSYTPARAKLLA
jgi:hypothetical protein